VEQNVSGHYEGDFVAWNGGCMFIGSGGGAISTHAHYAIQVVLGSPDGLRVQLGSRGLWESCAGAVIPSRASHSIDVRDCEWSTVIFVEPETPEGKVLTARLNGKLESLAADEVGVVARRLGRAWRTEQSADAVKMVCAQFISDLTQTAPRVPSDPRVLAAMEFVRNKMDAPLTLAEVAKASRLSPSRFRHLFVTETGMPLRTYLLWRRFLKVWELLMEGQSLSAAAHTAGFADSAHLSRTSRTMFGLAPSAMQMKGPLSRALRRVNR
jgi:AraC family transcriptional regulator